MGKYYLFSSNMLLNQKISREGARVYYYYYYYWPEKNQLHTKDYIYYRIKDYCCASVCQYEV